jgi:endoglucanase
MAKLTRSCAYAQAMGIGWNLGNSFDAVGDNGNNQVTVDYSTPDREVCSWGNPVPTRDFIHAIRAKGYSTIRIPMTVLRRFHEVKDGEQIHYVIDPAWLKAYRQVVDWALAEGLHVVINIHHDSWLWLAHWHGDTKAHEYQAFCELWDQLAREFADEPDELAFETVNEPRFVDQTGTKIEDDTVTQPFMDALNQAAYDRIRAVKGNEHRMIIVTTLDTAFAPSSRLAALLYFIQNDLHNDPNVMATVHYYSEWVYSGSLGRTGFDEPFGGGKTGTPREHLRTVADSLDKFFTANGIGTFIGEWGLLGYDTDSAGALQAGEELKYYEEFLAMVRTHGFACAFWDNGTGIDRTDVSHGYPWKKPRVGEVMTAGLTGRSAYAKGPDTIYLGAAKDAEASNSSDLRIPLVLNGLSFVSVSDGRGELTEDHYSFDSQSSNLVLSAAYIRHIAELRKSDGILADLTLHFSAGADWHEYIIRASQPEVLRMPLSDQNSDRADDTDDRAANDQAALDFHEQQVTPAFWKEIAGTREQGITIPLRLNGNELKSVAARRVEAGVTGSQSDPRGSWLGPQSGYWDMLQNGGSFTVHTDSDERLTGSLTLLPAFFECESVQKTSGPIELFCTFQSGATLRIVLLLQSDRVVLVDVK